MPKKPLPAPLPRNHIDLFSGIGGFSLAARWNGLKTEVFCEKDERCRRFLQRTYPGVPVWDDIKTFDGTEWQGRFLLTAGVPCQPASRAQPLYQGLSYIKFDITRAACLVSDQI